MMPNPPAHALQTNESLYCGMRGRSPARRSARSHPIVRALLRVRRSRAFVARRCASGQPGGSTPLVGIVVTKLVYQLIRDDAAAPREGLEPINRLRFLHGERLLRSRQGAPSQFGDYLADGLSFPLSPLPGGLHHIVSNAEGRPHPSDDKASNITCPELWSRDTSRIGRRSGVPPPSSSLEA